MDLSLRLLKRACAALLVLSACAKRQAPEPSEVTLHTGTLYTLDPGRPEARAMAVRGGRILRLGTVEALAAAYPGAARVDHGERVLLPGFVDSHAHVYELGLKQLKANLEGATTEEELVARLRAFYPSPRPGEWLLGQGWDEGAWASRGYPDRRLLDEAFPHNPVRLQSLHGFAGLYNGRALELAGLSASTPDPEVGRILRRADGAPTGVLETLAQRLVDRHAPALDDKSVRRALLAGLESMVAEGVTQVHEAGVSGQVVEAYLALDREGRLPCRVYVMLNGNDTALMQAWLARGPHTPEQGMAWVKGVKVFYDGSLGSRTALLFAPYADAPHQAKMTERMAPEAIRALAESAAARGFQLAVHAIGDAGNERVLSLYEQVLSRHSGLDHRWRIEHAQVVREDFFARAARLGVWVSMQSSHAVGDSRWAEARLGPERIRNAYAWRSMLAAGVPLILNSDLPGEPWTPAQTLYFAVTRQSLEGQPPGGWYPEQRLTVAEALAAMTRDGARAAFLDKLTGTLAEGLEADFVVLEADPFRLPPERLADLRVLETWVRGRRISARR